MIDREQLEEAFIAYTEAESTEDTLMMANFDPDVLSFARDAVDSLADITDSRERMANLLCCGLFLGATAVRQIRGET